MGSLRKRYPAQQLRVQSPPPQTNGYAESEGEEPQAQSPSSSGQQQQKPGRANSHKRRSYPLQHLSNHRLRDSMGPSLPEDDEPEAAPPATALAPAPQQPQAPMSMGKQSSMRRRYPASGFSASHRPQTNFAAQHMNGDQANGAYHAQHDDYYTSADEREPDRQSQASTSRANSARRRPYPAQALPVDRLPRIEVSRDNLQEDAARSTAREGPTSEHLHDDASMQQTPSSPRSSEGTACGKDKRRAYPTQTLPIDKVLTPRPSREVLTAELEAQHIPPKIHAVKDAEASKGRQGRTLVVCLDGTGDKFDNDNSNIVHFVECLKKDDEQQAVYYQPGIGTYGEGQQLSVGFSAALDMAVGSGLGIHIRDAYRFLMQTYREGDRICLFGFSRGAYTARCLAGMIHKVGLLPASNGAQVPFAYEMYKDETKEGWDMSHDFKKTFCNDVRVYFIGVFDSVASVGMFPPKHKSRCCESFADSNSPGFIPRKLPLSANPSCQPGYFRHAVALDEHRAKFKTCLFQKYSKDIPVVHNDPETDVLEVWFAGCHADVGGGAVHNKTRHMLSRIPLRWMIRQCFDCDTGIIFHSAALAEKGLDVETLFPHYRRLTRPAVEPPPSMVHKYEEGSLGPLSRRSTALETRNASITSNPFTDDKGYNNNNSNSSSYPSRVPAAVADLTTEQMEDYFDALAPINDQLVDAYWSWILLELWPVKVRLQDPHTGVWSKKVRPNMCRYRGLRDVEPAMHWTVRQRMESKGYKPRVRTGREVGWKVVV